MGLSVNYTICIFISIKQREREWLWLRTNQFFMWAYQFDTSVTSSVFLIGEGITLCLKDFNLTT